ncbi:MAG: HD domain-containing phosphohydrolase [Verrucomicrobiota bacterium]
MDSDRSEYSVVSEILDIVEQEISPVKDLDVLLDKILFEARSFTGCDAGSLLLVDGDSLIFSVVQNDTLFTDLIEGKKSAYISHRLPISEESIAGYIALTGESLLIDDVYDISEEQPYHFNRSFDEESNYRTQSVLTVPLKGERSKVLGVMQLINAKNEEGAIGSFTDRKKLMADLFAREAAVALERAKMTRSVIMRMIKMAEYRDPKETGPHVHRVGAFTMEIYDAWARNKGIDETERIRMRDLLRTAAMLHDVGKVAIPDAILKKPGKLTDDEFETMKWHTAWGGQLFDGSESELELLSKEIALSHHEKWNGRGYPGRYTCNDEGDWRPGEPFKGEEISIYGRIVALADVYDALMSKRAYKEAWDEDRVLALIREESGGHFDPDVVEAFFEVYEVIQAIRAKYSD